MEKIAEKIYFMRQEFLADTKLFYQKYLSHIHHDYGQFDDDLYAFFKEGNQIGLGLIHLILPISPHICIREYLKDNRAYEYTDKLYKLSQELCSPLTADK